MLDCFYLVAYGLPVEQDLFLQKLKQTWREELEVLNVWLLRWTRSLSKKRKKNSVRIVALPAVFLGVCSCLDLPLVLWAH